MVLKNYTTDYSERMSVFNALRLRILTILAVFHFLVPLRNIYNSLRYILNFRVQFENARYRRKGTPDGLPMPSPWLMHLVSGRYNLKELYQNGEIGARCIQTVLQKNELSLDRFSSILDFGCGCGRVMRFWKDLKNTKIYGTDYDPNLVGWCQQYITFAQCSVNKLDQQMDYADGQFDFIYAISVFTHLSEPLQHFWISELRRILRPGGYLYITVLGASNLTKLSRAEKIEFDQGKLIVENSMFPGTGICRVFHPEIYFRRNMTSGMTVVDFIPGGAIDAENQDVFLLKK